MYRIMECLLRAEDVAKKDSKHTRKYSFQVQSLRVCRELHGLGTSVFRLNHFLLVSIGNSSIMKFVDLHLLHYFTAKLKNLKEYSCRIHISSKHEKMKPSTFFVMCLTDIPVLVNALRECAFMYEQEMKLHFQIKAIEGVFMPVKQQRTLPLPFIKLRGTRQTCIITGADPALACEVSTKVSHNTHWKRDQLRKHFEILEIKKQLADDARMNGHDIVVRTLYESVMDFIAGTSYTDDMAIQHNEPSFVEGKKMIFFESELFLSRIDMSCVCLQEDLIYFRRLARMSPNTWPDSLRDWEAIHLQRMGVAKFAYGYFDEAAECFESALEILEALGNNPTSVQRCQELQAAASDSELVIQGPQTWQEIVMSFVRLLPSSHETKPFVLEVPTLAGLEQDLYDLEVLGYIGDLHEGELKQKKGWSIKAGEEVNEPFDKRIRDKQLAKYLAEDAECDAKSVPRLHRDVAVRTGRPEDDAPPIDPQVDLAQYATFLGTSTSSIAIPLEHNTFGGLPHYAQLWAQNPYY
jgi:tetratricopeptide (TPR) repeat protein